MRTDASKGDAWSNDPEPVYESGNQAPEVIPSFQQPGADGLQAIGRTDSEGLQAMGAQPYHSISPFYGSDAIYEERDMKAPPGQWTSKYSTHTTGSKRRIWIIAGVVALILVVIAIGVGVGVGMSQENRSPPTTTSTPTSASTVTSSTYSAVTSGATGLAQFSCSSGATVTSSEGVAYSQDCFTQYQDGGKDFYDHDDSIENIGATRTVYTFQDCIDACDQYNTEHRLTGDPPCKAVTYYANLTVPVSMYGGSCFTKSGRGVAYNGDPFDYAHTASAYWSCLDETTCIQ